MLIENTKRILKFNKKVSFINKWVCNCSYTSNLYWILVNKTFVLVYLQTWMKWIEAKTKRREITFIDWFDCFILFIGLLWLCLRLYWTVILSQSTTVYLWTWNGREFYLYFFPFMTELDLPRSFLFPWLCISMPVCCMRQKHACLHARGKAKGRQKGHAFATFRGGGG